MQQTVQVGSQSYVPLLETRIDAYHLLRQLFIQEPTRELLQSLVKEDSMATFPFQAENAMIAEGITKVRSFMQEHDLLKEATFEHLHWDYTRMFVGPYRLPAPPWESAYMSQEGLLFQKEMLDVRQAYLRYELLPEHYGHEADDHLGLELDFMYQLSVLAWQANEAGDQQKLVRLLHDLQSFIHEHLLKWVPHFCEKMYKNAETQFYQGIALLLHGFLILDTEALQQLLAATERRSN
ncbi:TorD/DmsD family molecular chaperone [Rubeoparvulum massiliense]|uniref:TorD/DmsD family molecular chaperone n=1 Tax=Rubeoparvulum massiliense TaxID=1631346 RepID=UPI00065DE3AC|nr:molecular chaperone TorD family protein [Rubeoparvulum massiliense]